MRGIGNTHGHQRNTQNSEETNKKSVKSTNKQNNNHPIKSEEKWNNKRTIIQFTEGQGKINLIDKK
jgi:hypothetical protein